MTDKILPSIYPTGSLKFNDPQRADLPVAVDRPTPYRVVDDCIFSEALEIAVTEHCNFSCKSCSHLAPILKKSVVEPSEIKAALSLLSRHYKATHVRLVGGEPLLHPRLVDLIEAIKLSGVTERVRVITNGSLPNRMTPEFWVAVDEVHISIYPGKEMSRAALETLAEQSEKYGKCLVVKRFDRFRETYAQKGSDDFHLINRIYRSCQIAHTWRCHTVSRGYFYLCPQSIFVPMISHSSSDNQEYKENGLKISGDSGFGQELLRFLESEDPLSACSSCLGSVGKLFNHEQVPRNIWTQYQQYTTEELLDREFLEQLESDPDKHNGCFETMPQ